MHNRNTPSRRSLERSPLKKAAVLVAVASIALGACSHEANDAIPAAKGTATAEAPAQSPQIESTIRDSKPVDYYRGNLIAINKEGQSNVIINPVVASKPGGASTGGDITGTHDFFALVTDKDETTGLVTFHAEKIDLNGYHVGLYPAKSNAGIEKAVVRESGNELMRTPELFNLTDNENNSAYGYSIASFNYNTIGDTYFTLSEESNQSPVGVLMRGQALTRH